MSFHFTYSGAKFRDGKYYGSYSSEFYQKDSWPFEIEMTIEDRQARRFFKAKRFHWVLAHGSEQSFDLSSFQSKFEKVELYRATIPLPPNVFKFTIPDVDLEPCIEVIALPHWDEGEQGYVQRFNARLYCRTDLEGLKFVGVIGLEWTG